MIKIGNNKCDLKWMNKCSYLGTELWLLQIGHLG